ncbi:MAG: tetratricopeptide repeat protein [Cyclobacteriaceae bacterium]
MYNQMGLIYKFRSELSKAGSYFQQALKISETRDIYHNFANLKIQLGDTAQAEQYFLKAINLSKESKLVATYIDLGELYHLWGKEKEATHYLSEAYKIYEQTNDHTYNHIRLFELMADASTNPEEATSYKDMAITEYKQSNLELEKSNDLFFGAIADEKVRSLEIKRAFADSSQDYLIIIISVVFMTLVLLGWLIYRIRKSAKEKRFKKAFEEIEHIFYEE